MAAVDRSVEVDQISTIQELSFTSKPSLQTLVRGLVLFFICFMAAGTYFCSDAPAAMETQLIEIS